MARPGLIVGLGGTGTQVLTILKRELLLANNGRVPDNVRLLALDTSTNITDQAESKGGILDPSERVFLGTDISEIVADSARGQRDASFNWFEARRWLETLPRAAFMLAQGTRGIRQLGRMALFSDLSFGARSQSLRAIRRSLSELSTATRSDNPVRMAVVASMAGGTGSGMLVDTALLLRQLAGQQSIHHTLSGFLGLPGFHHALNERRTMMINTFACWREVNRFMAFGPNVYESPRYNRSYLQSIQTRSLFDVCYLLDGVNDERTYSEDPRYGAYPAMAEFIRAMLDEYSGEYLDEHLKVQVAVHRAMEEEKRLFSTFGVYALKIPSTLIEERHSIHLCLGAIRELVGDGLLRPNNDSENAILSSETDRRRSDQIKVERDREPDILVESFSYRGETGKPSPFMRHIASYIPLISESRSRARLVDQITWPRATDPITGINPIAFFGEFISIDEFENLPRTNKAIELYGYAIKQPTHSRRSSDARDKQTVQEFRFGEITRLIERDVYTKFGYGRPEDNRSVSEFEEVLLSISNMQAVVFRTLVKLRLAQILTGEYKAPQTWQGGRLGYAVVYFKTLADNLEGVARVVEDAQEQRNSSKLQARFQAEVREAKAEAMKNEGRRLIGFLEHPEVRRSQEAYFDAMQRMVVYLKTAILQEAIHLTVSRMNRDATETWQAVERMFHYLSSGNVNFGDAPGVLPSLRSQLDAVEIMLHEGDNAAVHLIDYSLALNASSMEPVERAFLDSWQWTLDIGENENGTFLRAQSRDENSGKTVEIVDPSSVQSRNMRGRIAKQNEDVLLGTARWYTAWALSIPTIAEHIIENYPDPKAFADELHRRNHKPLCRVVEQAAPRIRTELVSLQHNESPARDYFSGAVGVEGILRLRQGMDPEWPTSANHSLTVETLEAEEPTRFTHLLIEDLYRYDSFYDWDYYERVYAEAIGSEQRGLSVTAHVFRAEANAFRIEQRLMQHPYNLKYRPLHPRLVNLLEEPQDLVQFIQLVVLGRISEVRTDEGRYWEFDPTDVYENSERLRLTGSTYLDGETDILSAAYGFVFDLSPQHKLPTEQFSANVQAFIDRTFSSLDDKEKARLLRQQLDGNDGLIRLIEREAYSRDVPERLTRRDLADLSLFVRLVLNDQLSGLDIEELEEFAEPPGETVDEARDSTLATETAEQGEEAVTTDLGTGSPMTDEEEVENLHLSITASKSEPAVGESITLRLTVDIDDRSHEYYGEFTCLIESDGFAVNEENASVSILIYDERSIYSESLTVNARRPGIQSIRFRPYLDGKQMPEHKLSFNVIRKKDEKISLPDPARVFQATNSDLVIRSYTDHGADDETIELAYVVYSPHERLNLLGQRVGEAAFSRGELARITERLRKTLVQSGKSGGGVSSGAMTAIGHALYDLVFSSELKQIYGEIGDKVRSLLILSDAEPSIPWELIKPRTTPHFLGQAHSMGRWVEGLGAARMQEYPLGQVAVALDQASSREMVSEEITSLFDPGELPRMEAPLFVRWSGSYLDALAYDTTIWGLHLVTSTIENALMITTEVQDPVSSTVVRSHAFDFRQKKPLVTLSSLRLADAEPALSGVEQAWLPVLLRNGASAFVGTHWTTDREIDRLFWECFYEAVWQGKELGDAVHEGRWSIARNYPNSADRLAYFLIGDPQARGYIPEESSAYVTLECEEHDLAEPITVDQTYTLTASLRMTPPDWDRRRRKQILRETWKNPRVYVFAPKFEIAPGPEIFMEPTSSGLRIATFNITPRSAGSAELHVRFLSGKGDARHTISVRLEAEER